MNLHRTHHKSLMRSLLPIVDDNGSGSKRWSRESTLHLLQALIGALVLFGVLAPDQVDAITVNMHSWQIQGGLAGLWAVFQALASNFRRHREK